MGLAMLAARAIGARGEVWLLGVPHKEGPCHAQVCRLAQPRYCSPDDCRRERIVFIEQQQSRIANTGAVASRQCEKTVPLQ